MSADFVLEGATIVTCDGRDRVLQGDVLVRAGRIVGVGGKASAAGIARVDARDRIVLPGFVMAHVHLCQVLMRGLADDLALLPWLEQRIWPLEAAHDERSLRASAELGLLELSLAGATSLLDLGTVHDHDVVFDACLRAGLRVAGGKSLMDRGANVPRRMRETTRTALASAEDLAERWGAHPSGRLRYVYVPRFILSCSEALIRGAAERSAVGDALLHTHASEHAEERRAVARELGASDVRLLTRWGLRGPRASLAHCVQVTPAEMRALARAGTSVVHCPSTNLKLGSGLARVADLLASGVRVGLGADGAPANNNLDPWVELRHAALIAAARSGPGSLVARAALRLATIEGARLLGWDAETGSIEPGKAADLVVVRRYGPHTAPATDPIGTLVYATTARDVERVYVAGRALVVGGEHQLIDAERVVAGARREVRRLAARAGLGVLTGGAPRARARP
jgi:5-methylthioadenosine/S-adenosylhomocysteine deaminase